MPDIKGIVLHKILSKDEGFLEAWSKLKLAYFGTEYASIYKALSKFYIKHSTLPSFEELEIQNRNPILKISLEALKILETPEVELDLAVDALINEYTQEETLIELDKFIDNITLLDTSEIKENLGQILLNIEEKTLSSEEIILMSDIDFEEEKELLGLMPLGLNNTFDAEVGGAAPTELIAVGGVRGTGKSNVCSNLTTNQYEAGFTSVYFSIEMRGREVFNRHLSLLSGVSLTKITKADVNYDDLRKIARVRADMFIDAEHLYEEFLEHRNYKKFKQELMHTKQLKEDNQLIIVDNQNLTLANIDLSIQKFKAQFKDKLKLVVVDYLNQIEIPDKYEWKTQIELSAKLKSFARKHDIILITPYQIDNTGEARFSKGILDAVDVSMNLSRSTGRIEFQSTKTRGQKPFKFASPVNEETMRIDPDDTKLPPEEEEEKDSETKSKPKKRGTEMVDDIPWN